MSADRVHFVYRCYDADGDLIYVGCSKDVEKRLRDHAKHLDPWVQDVQFIELDEHPDFESARAAEARAIASEHPYRNNTGRWPARVDWSEAEYQRWGHMLMRPRPKAWARGYGAEKQIESLHRLYMIKFGRPFPTNPKRGTSRRRHDAEVAA